jgi:hypothetical protein
MTQPNSPSFTYRFNFDGTVDSICTKCFVTVANSDSLPDIQPKERDHVCDPVLVERYAKVSRFLSTAA